MKLICFDWKILFPSWEYSKNERGSPKNIRRYRHQQHHYTTTVEISNSLFIFQWISSVEWACKVGRGMENLINLRRLRFIVCDDCIDWFWINVCRRRQKDWMVNQWVNENRLKRERASASASYCLVTIYIEFPIKILWIWSTECRFNCFENFFDYKLHHKFIITKM